jgi:large subunit ribosomal protein L17
MRHRKAGVKLNRTASHRKAMFRNMVTSLFKYDRIKTTDAKAKEIRRWADQMITLAKRGDLHARRQVMAVVREKSVVHKLFEEASQRFGTRKGGYTRLIKLGRRPGDAAAVSMVELISTEEKPVKKKKPAKAQKTESKDAAKVEKKEEAAPDAAAEAETTEVEETAAVEETAEAAAPADEAPAEEAAETAPAEAAAVEADEANADATDEADAGEEAKKED